MDIPGNPGGGTVEAVCDMGCVTVERAYSYFHELSIEDTTPLVTCTASPGQ